MKTTFKLGSLSFNFSQEAMEVVLENTLTAVTKASNPAKTGTFEMNDIEVTVEYDVTELPAIYKEVLPPLKEMMKDIMVTFKEVKLADIAAKAK